MISFAVGDILLGALVVILLIQLFYYLVVFGKLAFAKINTDTATKEPVSIIICARNEMKNLKENLESVLTQNYPEFQVVVVNDCSWDESEKYLEELQPQYPHLKIVTIAEQEKYRHGKKFALTLGIKAAKYETLLLTDADCRAATPEWIATMMAGYSANTDIVIGYGAYRKLNGFLNKWIRMDTVFNAIQFLSYALNKNPYMGVGRNLSYKKSVFFGNKGFASHNHIMSGDDDLFVNETANASNTSVVISPASFTLSKPRESFSSWIKQKKRHISTGIHYKSKHKFSLALFFVTMFLFYLLAISMLFLRMNPEIIVACYFVRLLVQMIIFGKCMKKLGEVDILWMVPFFDIIVILLYPTLSVSNLLFKDKTWK